MPGCRASIYFTRGGLVSSYGDQCVPLDAGCPLPQEPDSAATAQGAFAISRDGGTPRLVAPTYPLSLLRSGHGALWGLPPDTDTSPAPIMRLDAKTGVPTAFAGGGLIASFAVDAAGIYWVRDGKLLFSALK